MYISKSMKFLFLTFIIVIACHLGFSQPIELVSRSDKHFKKRGKDFAFIEPATDINSFEFVATFKTTGRKSTANIQRLYMNLEEKAKIYGANSFRFISYEKNESKKEITIIIEAYFGTDSVLKVNFANLPENVVYIVGDFNPYGKATYTFEVNEVTKSVNSGTFYKQELIKGEEIKLNNGGFLGATIWQNWMPEKEALYFSLSNFRVESLSPQGNSFGGVSVNTGSFNQINRNLGRLLIEILEQFEKI
jgi:hypothetical protein